MSRFVGDARDFRKPGVPRVLVLTADLLDELGVAGCGRDDQDQAVKQWLADNEPNKLLALSLREDGFLDTNVSNNLSNEPRCTDPDDAGRADAQSGRDLHRHGRRRTRPLITRRSQVQILPPPPPEGPGHSTWTFVVPGRRLPSRSTGSLPVRSLSSGFVPWAPGRRSTGRRRRRGRRSESPPRRSCPVAGVGRCAW